MDDKIKRLIAKEGLYIVGISTAAFLKALYAYNKSPDLFGIKSYDYMHFVPPAFLQIAAIAYSVRFIAWAVRTLKKK